MKKKIRLHWSDSLPVYIRDLSSMTFQPGSFEKGTRVLGLFIDFGISPPYKSKPHLIDHLCAEIVCEQ